MIHCAMIVTKQVGMIMVVAMSTGALRERPRVYPTSVR